MNSFVYQAYHLFEYKRGGEEGTLVLMHNPVILLCKVRAITKIFKVTKKVFCRHF